MKSDARPLCGLCGTDVPHKLKRSVHFFLTASIIRTCIHNLKHRVDGSFSAILRCVFLQYTKYSCENAPCLAGKSLVHPASSAVNTGSKRPPPAPWNRGRSFAAPPGGARSAARTVCRSALTGVGICKKFMGFGPIAAGRWWKNPNNCRFTNKTEEQCQNRSFLFAGTGKISCILKILWYNGHVRGGGRRFAPFIIPFLAT